MGNMLLKHWGALATATTQKAALDAAIDAAEHYMKALRLAPAEDKKQLDSKCKELLTRAEKIKAAADWQSVARQTVPSLRLPVSKRKLTTREEIIILEGAKLNGFIFPPWERAPLPSEFITSDGQPFTDAPDLRISELQGDIFAGWRRPLDLLRARKLDRTPDEQPFVSVTGRTDLVQDVLTDCSVVASLCATTSRSERGLGKHASPAMYPCAESPKEPTLSPSGKYIFSFYFNGCFRKVVIDDRLPSSKTSRSLHVIDRNNPNFLWPALVEKAYLKVRGGYDFPGSNSGTDLWVLTGWIPEQVFLHNEDATSDEIWGRLFNAFSYGDVVLTIGTGKLTELEQQGLGLVSEHDYAILDMKEVNGRRQCLLKNPWAGAEPKIMQNRATEHDPEAPSLSPGVFWMDCEQVLQNFEHLYLNWNPGLFKYREDIHFTWDLSHGRVIAGCFVKNPQFAVYSETGGTVWLLLGKHFKTDHHYYLKNHGPEGGVLGFISIYIFQADGKRISLSDGALHRGPYVDSPNTLMRLEMPPRTTYTAVISEQSLPSSSQNFTFSAFSTSPVSLAPSLDKYLCLNKASGSWTALTAGGNAESARYSSNPQFSLQVSEKTDLSILLESTEAELATHLKLFWSNGQRIARVRSRDIIADSGDYRRGCALAETRFLDRGVYTIVCSTFAPDQIGRFTLWISSTIPCVVQPLASESAGRRVTLSGVGILPPGKDRMLAPLQISRLSRIKLIARNKSSMIGSQTVASSPVLMTVELGQGPYKKTLAISEDGSHCDSPSGVRVEDFDLSPSLDSQGQIWIVIERIGGRGDK
ncbi:Peptidase C2 calpain domain III [Penicillium atrosanguineum]|nr:Peptidase C2 calpain domain III [Penicillium atrosanguineum]